MVIPYPGMLIISVLEAFSSMLESFTPFYLLSKKAICPPATLHSSKVVQNSSIFRKRIPLSVAAPTR